VEVADKTVEEIREMLERGLAPFVASPQVDVRVVGFRSKRAYITGEVREPGTLPLEDAPLTVMDAINAAGGFTEMADRRRAMLTRGERQIEIDILNLYATGSGDLLLLDNDVLHIPDNRANRVFMVGELQSQVAVPLRDGRLTLAEAIAEVEGLDLSRANTAELYVIRGIPVREARRHPRKASGPMVYRLDARQAPALLLADGFELEPRDIVFVSASPLVRFNRVVAQYVPIMQALWQTDRILQRLILTRLQS
jgi:polysaccharide biosynthesis/export protein